MGDHPSAAGFHIHRRRAVSGHLGHALLVRNLWLRTPSVSPTGEALPRTRGGQLSRCRERSKQGELALDSLLARPAPSHRHGDADGDEPGLGQFARELFGVALENQLAATVRTLVRQRSGAISVALLDWCDSATETPVPLHPNDNPDEPALLTSRPRRKVPPDASWTAGRAPTATPALRCGLGGGRPQWSARRSSRREHPEGDRASDFPMIRVWIRESADSAIQVPRNMGGHANMRGWCSNKQRVEDCRRSA